MDAVEVGEVAVEEEEVEGVKLSPQSMVPVGLLYITSLLSFK